MLGLREIGIRLGAFELADVSLTVSPGEYVAVLGPSGVGKTVLLELVAGLRRADAGTILLDGHDITTAPPDRRPISIVHQDYALFPHMTVARNIAYGLRAAGNHAPARQRVDDLAAMLDITPLLERSPTELSGGEQQRVALARALAIQPKVLLLDEPLSALDANVRAQLRGELRRINRELGTAFIHVTHDPEEAMALGDRVAVLLDKRLRQVAAPEELFRRPSDPEVAAFLGMRNVLAVSAVRETVCHVCGADIHVSPATDATEHIWIAPEEIILSAEPFASSARNQFRCRVVDWRHRDSLLAVRVAYGELSLVSLITYASFEQLGIEAGREVYATFKSSAVHCL
ncbi:MAG: ABC transporter ATP-binding protein [Planctomycetota bacterium]